MSLRAYQPSFTAGELSPALHARVDLSKYGSGLKKATNAFIHPHGGASNRAGFEFISEVKDSANPARLIPFQFNAEQSYILEMGELYGRVFRDGGAILSEGSIYEFVSPYASTDLGALVFIQDADVMYITHTSYAPRKLSRIADSEWAITTPTFAPTTATVTGVAVSRETGTGATTYKYKVSAASSKTGEESLPSTEATVTNDLSIATHKNRVTWSAVDGADRYLIYKEDNGVYGYIGGTEGLFFVDENITSDLADTPQTAYNPFEGEGNFPRCVTFVDQRLAMASTIKDPQAVWASQSANYENFGYSRPRKESDGLEFRIRGRQVNEVRSMVQMRGLMCLTAAAEWLISGPDGYIVPNTQKIDNQGYRGSATVQPIIVGNMILFAQSRGGVIRDFSYEFSQDSFTGKDLTILARHLFEGLAIKAWGYAQAPHSIVWVVLDNGSLVTLTYVKEHDVWAWTPHETDGVFEDVTVVAEGREDVPYFIVKRTVLGEERRFIERLHTRVFDTIADAFFVDSGLSHVGDPINEIYLPHLKGKTVAVLADGNVLSGLVADATTGLITLPYAASKIHAGLPYETTLTPLDIDLGSVQGQGSVQARLKTVSELNVRVEKTRGIWIGPADAERGSDSLVEFKQREGEAWNEAISAFTGDLSITPMWDWTKGGNITIRQFDPLPMTILAIMPDLTLGN